MKVLKKLSGFSGSKVFLVSDGSKTFVRKIGNVDRNYERMNYLFCCGYNVPKIYKKEGDILDIEYIQSLDVRTFLLYNSIEDLSSFLLLTLENLSRNKKIRDYSQVYDLKLREIDYTRLPFNKSEIYEKLPKMLFCSDYFGDLTLENILYGVDGKFYLIDGATVEYDSYIFDIAKLRQDLKCKWFLRNHKISLEIYCDKIESNILNKFPEADNDYLLILMLLRVYKHAKEDSFEQKFLLREIERLWK